MIAKIPQKKKAEPKKDFSGLKKYLRILNYVSAAQFYLKDNFFLERPLEFKDIKNRLLGHWGGSSGPNFILAHLNFYLKENQKTNPKLRDIIFLLGPGHAFPGLQANLFLERSLTYYFGEINKNIRNIYDFSISYDKEGLANVIKHFGSPSGFPTHASPVTPGAFLEGGELGYSLANAAGAVMDNKDLIAVTVIGDGEAETATLATSWHVSKFINSKDNGVILPILNLNSYKISGPTIFGRMSNQELLDLFTGLGYEPHIIDARSDTHIYANRNNYDLEKDNVHNLTQETLDKCFTRIFEMKKTGETKGLPMIILQSDKGWTGIKRYAGEKIEGNHLSHQVPLTKCKTDKKQLKALEEWLASYKINELFSEGLNDSENLIKKRLKDENQELFLKEIEDIVPEKMWRMSMNTHIQQNGKGRLKELVYPNLSNIFKKTILNAEKDWGRHSPMNLVGEYLREIFKLNKVTKNFRLFSPDETYSNKIQAVFKEEERAFNLQIKPWDKDISKRGRVVEMLSENTLLGMLTGYILTGRHGFFVTYEAFAPIVSSMVDQYLKFLRVASEIEWRGDVSSLNIILTSPGWLQEHNGYSHQNPGFIDSVLALNSEGVEVYFPIDAVAAGYAIERMVKSKNKINVLCVGKDEARPLFLSEKESKRNIEEGMTILHTFSDKLKKEENYDLIIAGIGDYLSLECVAGIDIVNSLFKKYALKKERKDFKIGFLNISRLSASDQFSEETRQFSNKLADNTLGAKVFANFHGHPQTLQRYFFEAGKNIEDVEVRGYIERGGLTTLLHMHILNKTSRFHVASWVIDTLFELKKINKLTHDFLQRDIRQEMDQEISYINEHFIDSEKIRNWKFGL
ncbi:MAG: phosphoketolase family protein [Candidatus Pacebacteria bacterium]|nr:phosphoketolase family protein [Candidatus Paceibacterota bacterium]